MPFAVWHLFAVLLPLAASVNLSIGVLSAALGFPSSLRACKQAP